MSLLLDRLLSRLADEEKLLTAFSGGADSALLAYAAHLVLGERAVAVTAVSASLPVSERRAAKAFTSARRMAHVEVCTDELANPDYVANNGNRCYHCKSALFDALVPLATLMGARMALGTNLDDLGDHRPGQSAAANRGAIFPMVDAGLSKADVRVLSRELGLSTADKPAAACLSSRIAYGDQVTAQLLARIEESEEALRAMGFHKLRVRSHADGTLARVEVDRCDLSAAFARRDQILAVLRDAGFTFGSLDLGGLRSGGMNALLSLTPVLR
ncbi:ATP-dependent sacrificial sulfur transferase LarE [soil metagenome]